MMCYIGVCLFCVIASTNGMGTPSPADYSNQGTGSSSDLASVKDDVHKVHVSLTRELGNLNVDLTNKITAEIRASRREMEERLGGQMNKLEERLGGQMKKVDGKIDKLEERLGGKIDKVEDKIDKMGDKIDKMGDKIHLLCYLMAFVVASVGAPALLEKLVGIVAPFFLKND